MWNQSSRVLFHGTNSEAADQIISAASANKSPSGVDLQLCKSKTDFGKGFYTTSNLRQAISWANYCHDPDPGLPPVASNRAAVLSFEIEWDDIGRLAHVGFSWEGADSKSPYWAFVTHCRGNNDHNRRGGGYYDVDYGPVSVWQQMFIIDDCDQISFHTTHSLNFLRNPKKIMNGTASNPTIP